MKIRQIVATAVIGMMLGAGNAVGQERQGLSPEEMEELGRVLIEQLEASGALDRAVDRAIVRYVATQNEEERQAREREKAAHLERVQKMRRPDRERDHFLGDPDARFVLVEYSDFQCPFCQQFHRTAKEIVAQNPDVSWVYRHLPLYGHMSLAMDQAIASECAASIGGNKGFWEYSDWIFDYGGGRTNGRTELVQGAAELGMNAVSDRLYGANPCSP